MSRYFNREQKATIYQEAEGKCQRCGRDLPKNWHADHIIPNVAGGKTNLLNAQALCPECNQKKGGKSAMRMWPQTIELREWQQNFVAKYHRDQAQNFLLVATPGAGKTIAAFRIAHDLLLEGRVERIAVVCPTDHLRTQWVEEAPKTNLQIDKLMIDDYNDKVALTNDFIGFVSTYHHLSNPRAYNAVRVFCRQHRTLVIFDEIHHCGEADHLTWGKAINTAFEPAIHRLLLSGTPFRTDNTQIPFVPYEKDENSPSLLICRAGFTYGYGDALQDESVVRDIVFPGRDGQMRWEYRGEEKEASFQDILSEQEQAHRLRTAISAEGKWMQKILETANARLNDIREYEGHPHAGGLILASDTKHAIKLADLMKDISGEMPTIAISDTEENQFNASEEIKNFRKSSKKWIVAVKMVSEGVDIRRLRVGVYGTNITTKTFFLQAIGRVIRWEKEIEELQTAYFYVPEDPELISYIKEIYEQSIGIIEQKDKELDREFERMNQLDLEFSPYRFISSDGEERHHWFDREGYTPEQLAEAETYFKPFIEFRKISQAAKAQFYFSQIKKTEPTPTEPEPFQQSAYDQREVLKRMITLKVKGVVNLCKHYGLIPANSKTPWQEIHQAWSKKTGGVYTQNMSIEQMKNKYRWLMSLEEKIRNKKFKWSELYV